jgi:hypothetical protein
VNAEKLVQMGGGKAQNVQAILKMLLERGLMVKSLKTNSKYQKCDFLGG